MLAKSNNTLSVTPVVISFTPNYIVPAATCILSILEHSKSDDTYHIICLMTEALSEERQEALKALDENRLRFSFLNLEGQLSSIYVDDRYTIAASYRLLLPALLPGYHKVIYIDCDVIVRNNLAELYSYTGLADNYLAGVVEATLDFQLPHMERIGSVPGSYINSGFLIMNLHLLRSDEMVSKLIEASKAEGLEFPDQDVLNQLCKGRIMPLPPIYNSIRTFYLPQYKVNFLKYYTEVDWDEVQNHGNIHYTGAKPWNNYTVKFSAWWEYYEKLPRELKRLGKVNWKMYVLSKICRTSLGHFVIEGGQQLYRKLKYKSV